MATSEKHPDWLAVGKRAPAVRRGRAGNVAHASEVEVVRHTKVSVFVSYSVGRSVMRGEYRFTRKTNRLTREGRYHAVPSYLDYVETLEPLEEQGDA